MNTYKQNTDRNPIGKHRCTRLAAAALTALLPLAGCGAASQPAASQPAVSAPEENPAAMENGGKETAVQNSIPPFTVSPIGNAQNTITVNSSEKVSVTPDIAEIVYAVRTEAKDAATCQQKNTEDANRVTDLLNSLGIAENCIQTSDYYMYPIYNYSGGAQRITGYEATAVLTVSDLPIDRLGNILTESVNAGINNIQSITYQSSQYDEGYAEALKRAVQAAKGKAAALAEAGGCSVGSVASIRENSNYGEARYTDNALAQQMRSYEATKQMTLEDTANIMPGEVDIEVNITVEYFIQ